MAFLSTAFIIALSETIFDRFQSANLEINLEELLAIVRSTKLISVCMATFNGERYLKEQIDSILPQLQEDDELIISDDGSTDETLMILKQYETDPRVRLLTGPKRGLIKNFEHALSMAKGDIIFLSDQDDIWLPNKVARVIATFNAQPKCLAVLSDLQITTEDLKIIEPSFFAAKKVKVGIIHNIIRNTYIGAGLAFRKELLKQALPFPNKLPMHDMWLGLLAGRQVLLLPEVLTLYRRHGDNASELETTTSFTQKLRWRIDLIGALIRRRIV